MNFDYLSRRAVQIAFGTAIAVLIGVGAFSYRSIVDSSQSNQWVRHSHEMLRNLQELSSGMAAMSSSIRRYILSGREADLASFWAAKAKIDKLEPAIMEAMADNPGQQSKLPLLAKLAKERVAQVERLIALRQDKGMEAAIGALRTGPSLGVTTEYDDIVGSLKEEELRLLDDRRATATLYLSETKLIVILGTLLGVLITAAAGWTVQRDSVRRGRAERALRGSEEEYRMLLDGVQDNAIFMIDPDGRVASWNAGAERIKGYHAGQIIGENFSCFFTPDDIARGWPARVLKLTAANGTHEEQGMRVRKDGTQYLASLTFTALRDSAGKLRGFSEFSHDLNESREAGAKYRGLLEAAPDAMVVVDQAGEIVLLNLQAEKQFGYHRDELVGQKVTNIIPEGFAERLVADDLRSHEEALAQQIGTGIELTALRKDGSEFPIEIMLSPLASAEGTLVTAAIRNISVRQEAEHHLAQMEGRYRGLLEAAPDAMVVVNQSGEIVLLNIQAEKQFGYRRDELLGQKVTNIIPEGFAERLIADSLRSEVDAVTQQIGTGIELIALRKDGSKFPIELMLSPLAGADGTLITAAIRNISVRKTAEEHLMQNIKELNRSNEELAQFAYIASHDLQEPLRMVASYTQLLSRRYKGRLDPDADEFIAFAVDGANRMQRLIQDLLTYSRVGSNGKELRATSSEVALQQALVNLRAAIRDSGAKITHDPLPVVLADPTQLTQLFQNLVGNAIKYQKPGMPEVHIAATKNGGPTWDFAITDNGIGIDPQYYERIFGMFQRLHKREDFGGTGIGLAICRRIVERHGGTITVDSKPGEGSTFHFALTASERQL